MPSLIKYLLAAATLLAVSTSLAAIRPEQIIHRPGITFVPVGDVYVTGRRWILASTIDLDPFHKQLDAVTAEIGVSMQPAGIWHPNYEYLVSLISTETNRLNNKIRRIRIDLQSLDTLLSNKHSATVYPFRFVFGSPDDDLRSFKEMLPLAGTNTEAFTHLVKEQTTIISKTVHPIPKQLDETEYLRNETKTIVSFLNETGGININREYHGNDALLMYTVLYARFRQIEVVLDEVKLALARLSLAWGNLSEGQLTKDFIAPSDLLEILNSISSLLPLGLRFTDMPVSQYVNDIYASSSVYVRKTWQATHVYIVLPLIDDDTKFAMYRPYAIPTELPGAPGTFFNYKFNEKFLFISKSGLKHTHLSDYALSKCKQTSDNVKICRPETQFYTKGNNQGSCLYAVYNQDRVGIHAYCSEHLTTFANSIFIHVDDSYAWIYFVDVETVLQLSCLNGNNTLDNEKIKLSGTGIFYIASGCSAETSRYTLPPLNTRAYTTALPKYKLIKFDPSIFNITEFSKFAQEMNGKNSHFYNLTMQALNNTNSILKAAGGLSWEMYYFLARMAEHPSNSAASIFSQVLLVGAFGIMIALLAIYCFKRKVYVQCSKARRTAGVNGKENWGNTLRSVENGNKEEIEIFNT